MPLFGPPNVNKMKSKGDINGLYKLLISENVKLREEARQSLVEIGPTAVSPILNVVRKSGYGKDFAVTVNVLVALGSPAIDELIAALDDPNGNVSWLAVNALRIIGDPRAGDPLLAMAANKNANALSRSVAIKCLADLVGPKAQETLIAVFEDTGSYIMGPILHREAAKQLGKIGDEHAIDPLIKISSSQDIETRMNALQSLGEIAKRLEDASVIDKVSRALNDKLLDSNREIRLTCVTMLVEMGSPYAVSGLEFILTDKEQDENVRATAQKALVRLQGESAAKYYKCSKCGKAFKLDILMGVTKTTIMSCRSCGMSICAQCGDWEEIKYSKCPQCGATALWEQQAAVPI